jgi:hypothetical protein
MLTIDDLVGYQRAEFSRASKGRARQVVLQFFVAVPAALSVFTDDVLALFVLATGGGILFVRTDRNGARQRQRPKC